MENKSSVNERPPSVKLSSLGTGDCALVLSSGTWLNSLLYAADLLQGAFQQPQLGLPWAVVRLQAS